MMGVFEEKSVSPMLIAQMQEPFNDDGWTAAGASAILAKTAPACGTRGTWSCSPGSLN